MRQPPRPTKNKRDVVTNVKPIITSAQRAEGLKKIRALSKELKMDSKSPKIVITGKTPDSMGTKGVGQSTIARYEVFWKHLLDYCILIEDYESGIILDRDECPADPLPVKLETATSFLWFKVNNYVDATQEIKEGISVECQGAWQGKSSVGLYRSALSMLHNTYGSTCRGAYKEACLECQKIDINQVQQGKSCRRHQGSPRFWRTGNVINCDEFKNAVSNAEKHIEETGEARHTLAFLPGEVRDLRTHLLSCNNFEGLMIWTIIIVGIKFFLRIEEALSLTVEQFQKDYFVVSKDAVKAIAIEVQGKRDLHKVKLAGWSDDECPEFDVVKAILIWMALSGITEGPLFPARFVSGAKGDPDAPLSYAVFLAYIKYLCTKILGKDPLSQVMKGLIFGTHMLRRTAFLFASWGFMRRGEYFMEQGKHRLNEMDHANLVLSARHKSIASTATYISDAGTLNELRKRTDNHGDRHRVGMWAPIHIESLPSYLTLNADSSKHTKGIVELSHWYFDVVVQIPEQLKHNIAEVYNRMCSFTPSMDDEEELRRLLDSLVPDQRNRQALRSLISKVGDARVRACQNPLLVAPGPAQFTAATIGPVATVTPAATRKRSADELVCLDKDYQKIMRKVSGKREKLELIEEMAPKIKQQLDEGKYFDESTRAFVNRNSRVWECVMTCHMGSIDAFLQANPGVAFSKFSRCSKGAQHKSSVKVFQL